MLTNPSEGEVFAPVGMFLEAVDLVLTRLKEQGADFGKVRGVSGAGMQHGTVFWSGEAEKLLGNLDAGKTLVEQLGKKAFSHPFSPNWQDASTQEQCEAFEDKVGGTQELAIVTGSKAHHVCPSGPPFPPFSIRKPAISPSKRLRQTAAVQRASDPEVPPKIPRRLQSHSPHFPRFFFPRLHLPRRIRSH